MYLKLSFGGIPRRANRRLVLVRPGGRGKGKGKGFKPFFCKDNNRRCGEVLKFIVFSFLFTLFLFVE